MTNKSRFKSTLFKSLLAASLLLPLFPFASPVAASQGLSVWLDGKALTYQQPLTVINNTTYVPLRETLEALGATVEWNAATGTIAITKGALSFNYDPKEDQFEGVKKPITQNGRLLIHIRALSYLIGTDLQWNAEKNAIELDTHKTALIEAIKSKNVQAVKDALQNGANPNGTMYDMESEFKGEKTLLHYAMISDDLAILKSMLDAGADPNTDRILYLDRFDMIKMLLDYGADPEESFHRFHTELIRYILTGKHKDKISATTLQDALKHAIDRQNLEQIQLLLEASPNPILPQDASLEDAERINSLLFNAVAINSPAIIELLADHGFDLNAKSEFGFTPLMVAAALGNASVIKPLLAAHADPYLKNDKGATAWMIAAAHGNMETVQALLDGGVKADDTVPTDPTVFSPFYRVFEQQNDDVANELAQLAPLEKAVAFGFTNEVTRLLKEGKTPNPELNNGIIGGYLLYVGYPETMKALFSDKTLFNQDGKDSMLAFAMMQNNPEVIRVLLENGANPNIEHSFLGIGLGTPLEQAVTGNNVTLIELLLKHGAKQVPANDTQQVSSPALAVAAENGNTAAVHVLLANMSDLSEAERSVSISTALDRALSLGNMECFKLLLNANPDQASMDQALYDAVSISNTEAVTALIQKGADPTFHVQDRPTALELALKKGNTEIVALLQLGAHATR